MTRLSVNVNKIATLRNARGGNLPDVVQFALDCERFGADGITVHPRPDERHITIADTLQLSKSIKTELNIEGYPDKRFMEIVSECRPTQATLVPDPPNVLTSNAGWDLEKNGEMLSPIIAELKKMGIRVALFMGTELKQIELAALLGADRIELYTGPYAENYDLDPATAISAYLEAAEFAHSKGLGINAGHDLSLQNLSHFKSCIPNLLEVSIGHALISEALYLGIDATIQRYQACLKKADF